MWVKLKNQDSWRRKEQGFYDYIYKVLDEIKDMYRISKPEYDDNKNRWYPKDIFEIYYSIQEVYKQPIETSFNVYYTDKNSATTVILKMTVDDDKQLYYENNNKKVSLSEKIVNAKFTKIV